MQRVVVVGGSGSGKTTLAARLAEHLGADHVQLDAIYHQPNWTPLPNDEFRDRVTERIAAARWVVDGNYSIVADIVQPAADTIVWIDLPRGVSMRRLVRRTLTRMATNSELYNGNTEQWRSLLRRDPEHNILIDAWQRHAANREKYEHRMIDGTWSHAEVIRLRTPADLDAFTARHA